MATSKAPLAKSVTEYMVIPTTGQAFPRSLIDQLVTKSLSKDGVLNPLDLDPKDFDYDDLNVHGWGPFLEVLDLKRYAAQIRGLRFDSRLTG
jgi:hypothetical protein